MTDACSLSPRCSGPAPIQRVPATLPPPPPQSTYDKKREENIEKERLRWQHMEEERYMEAAKLEAAKAAGLKGKQVSGQSSTLIPSLNLARERSRQTCSHSGHIAQHAALRAHLRQRRQQCPCGAGVAWTCCALPEPPSAAAAAPSQAAGSPPALRLAHAHAPPEPRQRILQHHQPQLSRHPGRRTVAGKGAGR